MVDWESRIAFLILNYNCVNLTINNAHNIRMISLFFEIVVVDNCSTDNSQYILEEYLKGKEHTWLLSCAENRGYASGNNHGLKFIEQQLINVDYVVIINPDVSVFNPNVIKRMYDALIDDAALAIITVQTIYNGTVNFPNVFGWKHYSKRAMVFGSSLIYTLFGGTLLGNWINPTLNYTTLLPNDQMVAYIDIAQGCFFMAKMKALTSVNYFDESTFLYFEEAILGKKIHKAGLRTGVLVDAYVQHNHKAKIERLVSKHNKLVDLGHFHRSQLYYIKYYSDTSALFKLTVKPLLQVDYYLKCALITVKHFMLSLFGKDE